MNGGGGGLERFVRAQEGVYEQALAELQAGAKVSHWMWFVLPQIAGLGRSDMARRYALSGLDEAAAYAAHPVLGARLRECTDAMLGWAGQRSARAILGGIDALKFASSMTLFEAACPGEERFAAALEVFNGGVRDRATLDLLASG